MMDFQRMLEYVIEDEGGYEYAEPPKIDQPTFAGITKVFIKEYGGEEYKGYEVAELQDYDVHYLYRSMFESLRLGDLACDRMAYTFFDAAVNVGPSWAIAEMQRLGATIHDGVIGPKTLAGLNQRVGDDVIFELTVDRLVRAVHRTQVNFLRGICNRILRVYTRTV